MRILNIVYNVEIKYQQHIKLGKLMTEIFGLTSTLEKTHKGKTNERGIFIIYGLLRNSFTAYSSSMNTT
jgi:hypothetical protein